MKVVLITAKAEVSLLIIAFAVCSHYREVEEASDKERHLWLCEWLVVLVFYGPSTQFYVILGTVT